MLVSRRLAIILGLLCVPPLVVRAAEPPLRLKLFGVEKIWDQGAHNAFTDLERFQGRFYCIFREGSGHVSPDGKVRVLESADLRSWKSAALIERRGEDLRDPKVTTTPDGRLMISGAAAVREGNQPAKGHRSFVTFSADGRSWSDLQFVAEPDRWLWRVTWSGGKAYGVSYDTVERAAGDSASALHVSDDGVHFTQLVPRLRIGDGSNEATIRFAAGGTAYCLHRRDGPPSQNSAFLGTSAPPYREWTWKDLGAHVGGPNLIELPGGRWIAAGRLLDGGAHTALCSMDVSQAVLTPLLKLPSGGDTSYPGLLWHDDTLWVSYYSSHEGKTAVYLARVGVEPPAAPIADIGSRLELFADHHLIEKLAGVELKLHAPEPAGVVVRFDRPWEGPFCAYVTVIQDGIHDGNPATPQRGPGDGGKYRMYYRGLPSAREGADQVTCYAESADGASWSKPNLGLFEVCGTRENNVILRGDPATHNFAPFLDARPGVPAAERFKALGGTLPLGLFAFASADGVHWRKLHEQPVMSEGQFDSQNVAFWSESEGSYLAFFRTWSGGVRAVSRATSKDFLAWTRPEVMSCLGPAGDPAPAEHLYTNQTHPYFRAPHIYIAFPMRFQPGRRVLSESQARELEVDPPYAADSTDSVFMTSRGGSRYDRTFLEAFLRPGLDPGNWASRVMETACGVVPTGPGEMSIYCRQRYAQPAAHLRRFTLRTDGFASAGAPYAGGELVTRPFLFAGKRLVLNVSTAAAGGVRVEIQDAAGNAVPGFTVADAEEIVGDAIERTVSWKGNAAAGRLAGTPVRLRFVMRDADVYSFRFFSE